MFDAIAAHHDAPPEPLLRRPLIFVLMAFEPAPSADPLWTVLRIAAKSVDCYIERSLTPSGGLWEPLFHRCISNASLVIADITHANHDVFFELGICRAMGKRVLYLSATDSVPSYVCSDQVMAYNSSDPFGVLDSLVRRILEMHLANLNNLLCDHILSFGAHRFASELVGMARFRDGCDYEFPVPPGSRNNLMSYLLSALGAGWCYDTVSQVSFWSSRNKSRLDLRRMNVASGKRGVRIRRVVMVSPDVVPTAMPLLQDLADMDSDVGEPGAIKTTFCKTDASDQELRRTRMHFAVVYRDGADPDESFVFAPCYNLDGDFDAIRLISRHAGMYRARFSVLQGISCALALLDTQLPRHAQEPPGACERELRRVPHVG